MHCFNKPDNQGGECELGLQSLQSIGQLIVWCSVNGTDGFLLLTKFLNLYSLEQWVGTVSRDSSFVSTVGSLMQIINTWIHFASLPDTKLMSSRQTYAAQKLLSQSFAMLVQIAFLGVLLHYLQRKYTLWLLDCGRTDVLLVLSRGRNWDIFGNFNIIMSPG